MYFSIGYRLHSILIDPPPCVSKKKSRLTVTVEDYSLRRLITLVNIENISSLMLSVSLFIASITP